MHKSAAFFGKLFFQVYASGDMHVADIGALNWNGSLKDSLPSGTRYTGIDFAAGNGVDVVIEDPYALPFPDDSFDIVTASSCLEHAEFFWLSFEEMVRVTRPGGLIYLNSPSNGDFHRYPVDCWRFYPDSGVALQNWAVRRGYDIFLLESFIGASMDAIYHDFVAVFVKGRDSAERYPHRMMDRTRKFTNGRRGDTEEIACHYQISPDQRRMPLRYFLRRLNYIGKGFR